MINKQFFTKMKKIINIICHLNDNWDDIKRELKNYFTQINDQPEELEFDKKYNIIEIAKSNHKHGKSFKLKNSNSQVAVDYYFYSKAPNGVLAVLSLFQRESFQNYSFWSNKEILLFVAKS